MFALCVMLQPRTYRCGLLMFTLCVMLQLTCCRHDCSYGQDVLICLNFISCTEIYGYHSTDYENVSKDFVEKNFGGSI